MSCDVCAVGERRPQLIRYSLSVADELILVDHVPAEVCDRCGEVTLSPGVVERLQQTVWRHEPPARFIETPLYEFVTCVDRSANRVRRPSLKTGLFTREVRPLDALRTENTRTESIDRSR
jgi:YgiT-type zinc finger domain-containing protein